MKNPLLSLLLMPSKGSIHLTFSTLNTHVADRDDPIVRSAPESYFEAGVTGTVFLSRISEVDFGKA